MATTKPAHFPSSVHMPRTSRHRVPAAHAHEAGAGEPRVRSILLSGGSNSSTSAYARNGDHSQPAEGAPHRSSGAASPTGTRRAAKRTSSSGIAGEEDGALAAGRVQIGSSSSGVELESGEERPSSSASASKHLEEDLAAALASSPTPERTTFIDATSPTISMPAPRPRMSLELPAQDGPIDILYDVDHKLALAGTSPKPCIVPGNALHLIDDDPAAPRSQTPPSVIIVAGENGEIHDPDWNADEEGETPEGGLRTSSQPPTRPPGPRVRFRSRVRITSGLHRHRYSATGGTPTPCSSASDSPSSSISAPLRYQADEDGAWGPLGKRLSAYAAAGGWQRRTQVTQPQRVETVQTAEQRPGGRARLGAKTARSHNERTPLIRPGRQRSYTEEEDYDEVDRRDDQLSPEERSMRAAALRREEEAVFGKWPWRIFNRHWWWWHVEPVLCCCCSDDSDYEEF
ncbi:hypothetical protein BV20DRAFT_967257 [Pilatotrama ljubarskyi]|nr:hypothetical protein BV20DRAFT_967257 [Pilatotrama ljubarskyi]